MKPAQDRLQADLDALKLQKPVYPVACNVEAALVTDDLRARDTLLRQVTGSVKWEQCIHLLIAARCADLHRSRPRKSSVWINAADRPLKNLHERWRRRCPDESAGCPRQNARLKKGCHDGIVVQRTSQALPIDCHSVARSHRARNLLFCFVIPWRGLIARGTCFSRRGSFLLASEPAGSPCCALTGISVHTADSSACDPSSPPKPARVAPGHSPPHRPRLRFPHRGTRLRQTPSAS